MRGESFRFAGVRLSERGGAEIAPLFFEMDNPALLTLILVVLCVATVLQAAALVGMYLAIKRVEIAARNAEARLLELRPQLERFGKTLDTLSEWADRAAEEGPRVARDIEHVVNQARDAAKLGALMMVRPLRPLGTLIALWRGLKGGARAYRGWRDTAPDAARPS